MDRAHPPLSLIKILAGLVFGMMLLATPMAAWAQASGVPPPANSAASQPTAPASPGQTQATSPSPAQAPGGAQSAAPPPSAAASEAPSTSSAQAGASPAPSGPVVRGLPTPVGGNPPQETPEPIPWLAYLLIALAAIWFLWAVRGITRLLGRPRGVPYPPQIPPAERDRPFLSFGMPFLALITVAVIVSCWGVLFLWLSHYSEWYPFAIDLFVVCLVMLIATLVALRGGGEPQTEVH